MGILPPGPPPPPVQREIFDCHGFKQVLNLNESYSRATFCHGADKILKDYSTVYILWDRARKIHNFKINIRT
jgi:hypothetical protein